LALCFFGKPCGEIFSLVLKKIDFPLTFYHLKLQATPLTFTFNLEKLIIAWPSSSHLFSHLEAFTLL
jgi:hypothetical protein